MSGAPIKVVKKDLLTESHLSTINKPVAAAASCEPQVQLIEASPGVYDIVVTCRCGEKTTIRCNSLEVSPAAPAADVRVSAIPAVKVEKVPQAE